MTFMFEAYRSEMRRQHKNIKGLAEFMGKTPDSVSKKMHGVNSMRLGEAYMAILYIEKPLSELPVYFPLEEMGVN